MVNGIAVDELCERFPRLYHMAQLGSWPSIQEHGLLSTTALLDLFELRGDERFRIESCHRPESIPIDNSKYGRAVIRDQKPMSDRSVRKRERPCSEFMNPCSEFMNKDSRAQPRPSHMIDMIEATAG